MNIRFQTPYQFLFLHRDVKHLLVIWEKERKKEIFLVDHEEQNQLTIRYPGESYQAHILDEIEEIFLPKLECDGEIIPVILAATFEWNQRLYAVYYPKDKITEELYFFEIIDGQLQEISDEKYEQVISYYQKTYSDYFA